jgi:hypothetical protein
MWTNRRNGRQQYKGKYERDSRGERVFVLSNGKRNITFESWQMAKRAGWIYTEK